MQASSHQETFLPEQRSYFKPELASLIAHDHFFFFTIIITITQGVQQPALATCLRSLGHVIPVTIFGSHQQALWFGVHLLLIAHTVMANGENRSRGVENDETS